MSIEKRVKIEYRQAEKNDIQAIMSFINTEWKEQHILARDQSFFEYEHLYDDKVNFIIACNEENEILGLIGFIICAPGEISDACTVIWKVAKPLGYPALGIKLLQFVSRLEKIRYIFSTGINESTVPIYSYLGMYTGKLEQYYILNPKMGEFKIAKIRYKPKNEKQHHSTKECNYEIKQIADDAEIKQFPFQRFKDLVPYKNESYFIKRYLQHPVYKYMIYGIYLDNVVVALIVLRKQTYHDSNVLRLVDYFGEDQYLVYTGEFFESLLIEHNSEYVDFYSYGITNDVLLKAGFSSISEKDSNIIPNYFAPFKQENITIRFYSNTNYIDRIRLCKADGDQDRPN